MPPSVVDDGVLAPLGAWLELQAGNVIAAVNRHTIMSKMVFLFMIPPVLAEFYITEIV